MKLIIASLTALLLSYQVANAQTVNCGIPYAASDRSNLRTYLVDNLRLMSVISRVHALATLSLMGSFSSTQRMALDNEYQALLIEITTSGNWHVPNFHFRTNAWLHRIVDSNFLGLTGTNILTEASANTALWATVNASNIFYTCY